MSHIIVTTTKSPAPTAEERARRVAEELEACYRPRGDRSLAALESDATRLIVIGPDLVRLRDPQSGTEYTFHPNMIPVRAFNRLRGARDLLLEAMGLLTDDSVLDCTLGFGSEATLAALVVGETGRVVGLESVPELAAVTREGLQTFPMPQPQIAAAMRRVEVVSADYRAFLTQCAAKTFDIVYFDPFFEERLPGSETSVSPLAFFGDHAPLDAAAVRQARRVARRRVVIKHPHHAPLPDEIAKQVMHTVTARRSRLAFSVIPAQAPEGMD